MSKMKRAHVLSDFNDSGTGENHKAGANVEFDEGVFANYEAAGLVRPIHEPKTASAPAHSDDGKGKPAA